MSKPLYSFGPFQLDTGEQILLRDGRPLPLKPKVFDLLVVLVENSGHVVCKDELMKQVWADTFVEEGNLAVSICEIRKALGGSANGHTYIATVPRRGYRFVASVTEATQQRDGLAVAPSSVTGVSAVYGGASKGAIAVLPFQSIGAAGSEYLGLGMADALITKLSNLRRVTVRPTSSIRKYYGSQDPVMAGKELSVEWVLDGSVRRSGKRIRVTVQLVNVGDGGLVWAERFDEKFTDIFAVEDSISEQVAKALGPKLTGEEKRLLGKRYTENSEAYEAYLKGRYFLDKRTTEGCKKGIEYFEQAIAGDPTYALAYTGLAGCYIVLGSYTLAKEQSYLNAQTAILSALRLDDQLAEAHASLGHLRTRQWDWLGAEKELKRAIELNPNYAIGHTWYAIYLSETGQFDKAFVEIRKAQALDPVSPIIEATEGSLFYLARRYDQAIERFHRALELDAGFALAHSFLGFAYEAKGNYQDAMTEYQWAISVLGNLPEFVTCLGRIHALAGRTDQALEAIDELRCLSTQLHMQPALIALIYTALGKKDDAFQWLERAYAERDADLCLLGVDPRLDSLREDPRFASLLQRVGLANSNHLPSSE
jgi:DNA-binding winged helix-turn-helix (wHTH) protein/TolB-like protein/Flp pilus assembly protein TadD